MIRIISGIYKGRRLKLVPSVSVRPIQDKVKGALFNIIQDRVAGSGCLDGFAGTGSIGLEALSRGAETVVFVDEFYPAIKVIRANVEKCGAADKAIVLHREFNRAVIDLARRRVRFDLVFLDPPYKLLAQRNPLRVIRRRGILKPGGTIVLRHHFKIQPRTDDFPVERRVRLGDDVLLFFSHPGPAEGKAGPGKGRPQDPARGRGTISGRSLPS